MLENGILVISRKPEEGFTIGDDIKVTIGEFRGNQIRVIIDAPKNLSIKRCELLKKDSNKNNKYFMREQAHKAKEGAL